MVYRFGVEGRAARYGLAYCQCYQRLAVRQPIRTFSDGGRREGVKVSIPRSRQNAAHWATTMPEDHGGCLLPLVYGKERGGGLHFELGGQ